MRLGEDVKITCPILGNPTPIVEWKKGGETIDYSWIRIRTQKKSLKIRRAQEEDTGVYVCKGVNGFGNVEVKVDLIIIGELSDRLILFIPVENCSCRYKCFYNSFWEEGYRFSDSPHIFKTKMA